LFKKNVLKHCNSPRVLFRGGKDTFIILIFTKNQGLLYRGLKLASKLAIKILCRDIRVNNSDILQWKGPLLLAANHPNSFLDSILLDTLFEQPVWALARGDAFNNKWHAKLLRQLHILPVYRTSEGTQNLSINYQTFSACVALFQQNQIVTIYSEALCVNEWHLRPLKKGTARLAIQAWDAGIPLQVIPVGINYSTFKTFGKNVHINFGAPITLQAVPTSMSDGLRHQHFNQLLQAQLETLVYEIPSHAPAQVAQKLQVPISKKEKIIFFLPAILGKYLHLPLYIPIRNFTEKKFGATGHYDSVLSAILLLTYPVYWLLFLAILRVGGMENTKAIALACLLPCLAWCHVRIKPQFDTTTKQ
jgi:1-acyl-sn-glycerol-3-phosphate acyltransferase